MRPTCLGLQTGAVEQAAGSKRLQLTDLVDAPHADTRRLRSDLKSADYRRRCRVGKRLRRRFDDGKRLPSQIVQEEFPDEAPIIDIEPFSRGNERTEISCFGLQDCGKEEMNMQARELAGAVSEFT